MNLPPEIQKRIDELTADLQTLRLPLHIAAATLPIEKEVQEELHHWHAALPLTLEVEGTPPEGVYASLSGSLDRLTWHTAGDYPQFFYRLLDYLDDYPISQANLDELDRVVQAVQPAQLGAWIEARSNSYDLGWYLRPEGGLFDNAAPYLPASPALERVLAWAEQYEVTECLRLGKSLVSEVGLSEVYLQVTTPTPRRAVEVGLLLFRYLGLEYPSDEILAALLLQEQPELVVSLQLGTGGLTKLGLMLSQPSTELVLRLWDASAAGDTKNLAIFEACLGAGGPFLAEPQLLAGGWGVELHYAVA